MLTAKRTLSMLGPRLTAAPFAATKVPLIPGCLLFALLLPTEMSFQVGSLRLSPYRVVLLLALVPTMLKLFQGKAGPLQLTDKALLLFCLWAALAFALRDGPGRALESGGIFFLESFGAYAIARVHVRNVETFRRVASWLVVGVALLAMLAIPEMLTGKRLVHDVFGAIFGGRQDTLVEGRMGLSRAYGPFDHPILYGTFCAAAFSIAWGTWSGWRGRLPMRFARVGLVCLAVCASLSSGCIMAVMLQAVLLAYRRATACICARWKLLSAVLLLAYTAVSMFSNRSGLKAILWYVTLSRETAAYRIMIWENATDNIVRYPLLGIGKEHWVRPSWMPESVDSFWLVLSLDCGLPGVAFLTTGVVWLIVRVGRSVKSNQHLASIRLAWVFTMIALLFTGFTVHYWNNVFVLFFMLLGLGAWMGAPPETPVSRTEKIRPTKAA